MQTTTRKDRFVLDPVHGYIRFPAEVWEIIDAPIFQRLRQIKQLGNAHHVYPGATHTRFAHSLGVAHLCLIVSRQLGATEPEALICCVAGLLHDLGHIGFSHLIEDQCGGDIPEQWMAVDHEDRGIQWMKDRSRWPDTISKKTFDVIQKAANILTPSGNMVWMHQLISNHQVDMDRMDYILRDCYYTGIPCQVQKDRILAHLIITPAGQLSYHPKIQRLVDAFMQTRQALYDAIYQHPRVRGIDAYVASLLRPILHKHAELTIDDSLVPTDQVHEFKFVQVQRDNGPDVLLYNNKFTYTTEFYLQVNKKNYI